MRLAIRRMGHHFFLSVGWMVVGMSLIALVTVAAYELAYSGMILPKVVVAGVEVSNTSMGSAKKMLQTEFSASPTKIDVVYQDKEIAAVDMNFGADYDWAIAQAYSVGRSGNILTRIAERVSVFFRPRFISLPVKYDSDDLAGIIARVSDHINQSGRTAKVTYDKVSDSIKLVPGRDGLVVDEEALKQKIVADLSLPGQQKIEVPTKVDSAAIDEGKINSVLAAANNWKHKTLRIRFKDYFKDLDIYGILNLLSLKDQAINQEELANLTAELKAAIETEPKDAVFNFDQGKVIQFAPEVQGIKVNTQKFEDKLALDLLEVGTDLEVPVDISQPRVTAGSINNLGIKELIGVGTSRFHGSIDNRIHNLTLASMRLNGALVAPGETFSLGQTIGDISKATGYLEAYVISQGRTVLGDGGGVCQVSTTLFRAILNAGLPIVERKAHAYRVHYYEEDLGPGYDATVFFPSADLKFINDTANYILIQTKVDPKNFAMRYELYGTKDGRVATVSPAKIYSQTPPLPTVYQDDPTLPKGQTKQVDWSAWGAKVSFDYKVTKNGETLQDKTFYSNYQPWAAVYLVGTGTAVASR